MTLQAPDFDFLKFPLDTQQFFIRLVSLVSDESYVYTEHPDFNKVGEKLGEEEWLITSYDTSISSFSFGLGKSHSQFIFKFLARRHLSYYFFRIFMPLTLIVIVSWVTFFMKDYGKRVDVSVANLLTFVAFNFTIASILPRLGYLTFLDSILILGFIVTVFTVVCNVALKRLATPGREIMVARIDNITTWGYPIVYGLGLGLLTLYFFKLSC
ncbi:MAG: hypothetical protein GY804_06760 [Alphaproteobacteria bacterium]|nr:hypothetical protein [Alphaproteobacteria bacterium]